MRPRYDAGVLGTYKFARFTPCFADIQGEDRKALAACAQAPNIPLDPAALAALPMPVLVVAVSQAEVLRQLQALFIQLPLVLAAQTMRTA